MWFPYTVICTVLLRSSTSKECVKCKFIRLTSSRLLVELSLKDGSAPHWKLVGNRSFWIKMAIDLYGIGNNFVAYFLYYYSSCAVHFCSTCRFTL